MTSAVIGGAVLQWPLGYLSDKFGRREVLIAASTVGAVVSVLIIATVKNQSFVGINLLGAAWGAAAFPLYTLSVAHANDHADSTDYVMVSSGLLLMYGVGAIIGPFIASAMMTLTTTTGLYIFTGGVHSLLIAYAVQRAFRRTTPPDDEQHIAFIDALATAHTASQVYDEEIQYLSEEEN